MINGVILQKLPTLDQVLAELRELGSVSADRLRDNWLVRRAVERDAQVLVEVVIDVCQRLISLADRTPAPTSADAIKYCIQMGAISDWEAYRQMIQFRNFVVHRYDHIDETVLAEVLSLHLSDFERFRDEVLAYAQR